MFKQVIKYILLILFFVSCSLFAQTNESTVEQPANIPMIPVNPLPDRNSINEIYSPDISTNKRFNEEINHYLIKQIYEPAPQKENFEPVSNVVSSFRNNIHFAGFWDKYAIVNFSPSVSLRPSDFISIYANHNFSCFIPVKGIKEHAEMLCIQAAAIMAVDNSIKILFGPNKMIPSIAGFVLKTLIINTVMSTINRDKENKILDYRNYYYSISIRF